MARIDWCTSNVNFTNFYFVFFTSECTFYLDNRSRSRWVNFDEDNIIYSINKVERLVHWQEFLIIERHLFSYMNII